MKTIALRNLGGLGNKMFRYAYARALAEQNGYELRAEPWAGEAIFTLDGATHKRPDGTEEMVIDEYCQAQKDLIYSRADCRRWFKIKPEIEAMLEPQWFKGGPMCDMPHIHLRRGDFAGAGYPLIGRLSAYDAMKKHGIFNECETPLYIAISDEFPLNDPGFTGEIAMIPDFYRLMRAPVLFRANSSFSYWAGVLSHGRVFSPVIAGLASGIEHDNVPYVEGNWPRLCELNFVTDLHLRET